MVGTASSIRFSSADRLFHGFSYAILTLILLTVLYPLYFVVIASFSEPTAVARGETLLWFSEFGLDGYQALLENRQIWRGYANSFVYLFLGTTLNIVVTIPAAYALSRKDLVGRGAIMGIFVFTMFFNGGLIPTYLLVQSLGMVNTIWPVVILQCVNVFYLIIARTFFESTIPSELWDSARVDGCTNTRFFVQIVLPVSKAIVAVMTLYYGVFHWNQFFIPFIYLRDTELYPLQVVLRQILILHQALAEMSEGIASAAERQRIAETVKYGAIIVASAPMLILYPFVQRFFVKGVLIGSIKG